MEWINAFGLVFVTVLLIPNAVFAIKCREGFENRWDHKAVEIMEQMGRFGCFGFMIFHIPGTWFGWWSDTAFAVYLIVDVLLVILYCMAWVIFWKQNGIFKALALSIIPSVLFLFSGIMTRSILLITAAALFTPAHILISYKNAKLFLQEKTHGDPQQD